MIRKGVILAAGCAAAVAAAFCLGVALSSSGDTVLCTAQDLDTAVAACTAPERSDGEKVVYLTFDDGPSSTTELVLDILRDEGVPATFFVTAAECNEKYLPLLERERDEGHAIGLHSCSHKYSTIYASPDAFWQDIDALKETLTALGCPPDDLLRFPGGSTNTVSRKYGGSSIMKTLREQALEKGYRYVDWNVCAEDAAGEHLSARSVYENIVKGAEGHNECIVLMHDTKATKTTAQALPDVIAWFRAAGYRFAALDEMPPDGGNT